MVSLRVKQTLAMILSTASFLVILTSCGGDGGGTKPTVSLKLVCLDGTRLELTNQPIPLRVAIEATFSEAMNTTSVEDSTSVEDENGAAVEGSFSWNSDNTIMTFAPQSNLKHTTTYHVMISANAASAMTLKAAIEPVDESFLTMTAGDVNGDGYADVIVGADGVDGSGNNRGAAYLFNGATLSGTKATSDALATINGAADDDFLGSSVSIAGDVNGDGYDDVIVGAKSVAMKGAAYVFSGATLSGTKETTDALATINGGDDYDHFGASVSGAGDVNNDGYYDVIIGAADPNTAFGNREGKAYVFSGATLSGTMSATDALATFNGTSDYDWLGYSVSSAGDVNGDEMADVIIGSPGLDGAGTNEGAAYLFSGASLSGAMALTDALATINGVTDYHYLGNSVSGAGDVNGDGNDDIIISATNVNVGSTDKGTAYVFTGSTLTGTKSPADALAMISGAANGDWLGISVSCAGDVNGDGYTDVIVGAARVTGGTDKGATYIYSGGTLSGTLATTDALATINGGADDDWFGTSVSGAGDVDGDGYDDVIIGSWRVNGGGVYRGAAYLFRSTTLSGTLSITDALATINGTNDSDRLGGSVSGAAY